MHGAKITVKFLTPIKQPMKKQNNRKQTSVGNKNSPRPDSKGGNHILSQRRDTPRSRGLYKPFDRRASRLCMWLPLQNYAKGAR